MTYLLIARKRLTGRRYMARTDYLT